MSLTIIIPAYNEQEAIKGVVEELHKLCENKDWKILVVNDCSKDNTKKELSSLNYLSKFSFINNKVNKGYGGAIKEGIKNADTDYIITVDADGQHNPEDVKRMYDYCLENDSDMIIGNRMNSLSSSVYREVGKSLIRRVARILLPINKIDINSGIKIYRTDLAKKYIKMCPDNMAYSDIIALIFINNRHLVTELDVNIRERKGGESTISTKTAFETVYEILNIAMMFNPLRIFLPIAIICCVLGLIWGVPIILKGNGISVGALLAFITGILFFILGLLAEQLSQIRKNIIN